MLADFKLGLNAGKWHSHIELNKRFNSVKHEQYEWCKALNQRAAHNAIYFNFQDAIRRWQSGQSRFPKFKKRSRGQSFQADAGRGTTIVEGHRIKLPKIGWVRMFQSLRYLGTICKVVISKHGHRWFASIFVDTFTDALTPEIRHPPVVGIDVGIKHLAVTSEGVYYENPKVLKRYERKLKRLQRQLSRREKGSRNWHKTKARRAKLHYRITCIRQDAQHKATTAIVNRVSRIGIESLNVAGTLKNAERMGVKIVEADTFYPSSKTCSACGRVDSDLSLSDRTYHCSVCGHTQDRDLNAAINLRTVAMGRTET